MSTAYETRAATEYQTKALDEVKSEHPKYFDALNKHPRELIGQNVPSLKPGVESEQIRDSEDAKEWQEAVKGVLAREVMDRAGRAMEENAELLNAVHASIELFQSNPDLIPGTKDFDVDLANRFGNLASPYELRVDGKLHGYTVPVQPLIGQLRTQLAAERAAKAAAPAAAAPAAAPAAGAPASAPAAPAAPAKPEDPPQAGIQAKAGESSQAEDFSTLFGTIGLPNLRI